MRALAISPVFALVIPAMALLATPRRSAFLFAFGRICRMGALRFIGIDDGPPFIIILATPCDGEYVGFNLWIIRVGGPSRQNKPKYHHRKTAKYGLTGRR